MMGEEDNMGSVELTLDIIKSTLVNGLLTDGAHHKQYALESVLRLIAGDEWVNAAHKDDPWEDGIPS